MNAIVLIGMSSTSEKAESARHKNENLKDKRSKFTHLDYGNTGCGLFKRGVQN